MKNSFNEHLEEKWMKITAKVKLLSVVIPTFNEAKTIRETIQIIYKVLPVP